MITPTRTVGTAVQAGHGSTIAFPYTPLADAEQVAHALHRRGGEASMDELAAELNQVMTSGAFRKKCRHRAHFRSRERPTWAGRG